MDQELIKKNYVAVFVVVESGMGGKVLKEAKEIGVSGGNIFLGKGTVRSHILEILGLDRIKKEIVLMGVEENLEDAVHKGLTKKFKMDKPNHGIIFSLDISRLLGLKNTQISSRDLPTGGKDGMGYEVVFTIVERGQGQEVVDAAYSAGATGATIINARGSGAHEHHVFFAMDIEPEKEIIMMIIGKEKSNDIILAIEDKMGISEPGKGIIFSLDVNKTSGLYENNKKN